MSPRGGGRGPQMRGRRPLAPARWSHSTQTPAAPSPPAAMGQLGAPSSWPPSTFLTPGETPPQPSSTPQDLRGPATVPGSQARQRPSPFPGDFSVGGGGQHPTEAPLDSTQATGTDQNKIKRRAINGGEQDIEMVEGCFMCFCFGHCSPVTGVGYVNLVAECMRS